MTTGFFIESARNAFLKFTVGIIDVSPVEAKVVEMNHQLEILGHVIFRPVLGGAIILKVVGTNLHNNKRRVRKNEVRSKKMRKR